MPDIPDTIIDSAEQAISNLSEEKAKRLIKKHFPSVPLAERSKETLTDLLYEDYAYVLPMIVDLLGREKTEAMIDDNITQSSDEDEKKGLEDLKSYLD